MDVNKNSYTFGFAVIMVIVVATLLAVAANELKPFQQKNIELAKQQDILNSIGVKVKRDSAAVAYQKYITESFVVDHLGNKIEGDAFNVDLSKELKKELSSQVFPVFVSEKNNIKSYIF